MAERELTRAAVVYDFDGTLSPGTMQQHTLLPELGFTDQNEFWSKVKEQNKKCDGDEILAYMNAIIIESRAPVKRELFEKHGKTLPFFNGVREFFKAFTDYALARDL